MIFFLSFSLSKAHGRHKQTKTLHLLYQSIQVLTSINSNHSAHLQTLDHKQKVKTKDVILSLPKRPPNIYGGGGGVVHVNG